MAGLHEQRISCPFCGENITLLLDLSVPEQDLIEDCQVCCQPMQLHYGVDADDNIWIDVQQA
ncbi:hypothetical protein J2T55_001104 [Methylohalomonas lacus]|uniref:CPXCG motif-containing cysteine-rich protein n=1 Tax=Methylohalomonas lacus TaxID=398773 RepID=A0AAE3L5C1_9GAMM|nr:CPXCG motif-containing cysteine-rich protein [Methylohalomonas lacus]MCS3903087.1 hypothetical protein [Methylohalomonas lacus]